MTYRCGGQSTKHNAKVSDRGQAVTLAGGARLIHVVPDGPPGCCRQSADGTTDGLYEILGPLTPADGSVFGEQKLRIRAFQRLSIVPVSCNMARSGGNGSRSEEFMVQGSQKTAFAGVAQW